MINSQKRLFAELVLELAARYLVWAKSSSKSDPSLKGKLMTTS